MISDCESISRNSILCHYDIELFIILDAIQKARAFLEVQISVNDDVGGFMASLSMLAGVAVRMPFRKELLILTFSAVSPAIPVQRHPTKKS